MLTFVVVVRDNGNMKFFLRKQLLKKLVAALILAVFCPIVVWGADNDRNSLVDGEYVACGYFVGSSNAPEGNSNLFSLHDVTLIKGDAKLPAEIVMEVMGNSVSSFLAIAQRIPERFYILFGFSKDDFEKNSVRVSSQNVLFMASPSILKDSSGVSSQNVPFTAVSGILEKSVIDELLAKICEDNLKQLAEGTLLKGYSFPGTEIEKNAFERAVFQQIAKNFKSRVSKSPIADGYLKSIQQGQSALQMEAMILRVEAGNAFAAEELKQLLSATKDENARKKLEVAYSSYLNVTETSMDLSSMVKEWALGGSITKIALLGRAFQKDKDSLTFLRSALNDQDPRVRYNALKAIYRTLDIESLPARSLFNKDEEIYRKQINDILDKTFPE